MDCSSVPTRALWIGTYLVDVPAAVETDWLALRFTVVRSRTYWVMKYDMAVGVPYWLV